MKSPVRIGHINFALSPVRIGQMNSPVRIGHKLTVRMYTMYLFCARMKGGAYTRLAALTEGQVSGFLAPAQRVSSISTWAPS